MDSELTNGKLFCVSQQHASTDRAYTDIHSNNVPSLGLEQQHEKLCSNAPRVCDIKEMGVSVIVILTV